PRGGAGSLVLQGRHALRLSDTPRGSELGPDSCGGLPDAPGFPGVAPARNAFHGPGLWHALDLDYRAPRFDAEGRLSEPARLLRLRIDDQLVHENVELSAPNVPDALEAAALGPLVLRAEGGLAVRELRFRPATRSERTRASEGWTRLLVDEDELERWTRTGGAFWELEQGVLQGEGPVGHLFSPRSDYRDFELRARVKVNEGGNSGIYLRASPGST